MGSDFRTFVLHAQRVRDYGIRSGTLPDDELIDALVPFDLNPKENDAQKILTLRRAARRVYARIDEVTLDAVFSGRDPTLWRPERPDRWWLRIPDFVRRNAVILVGMALLLAAFHFTHWTNRADLVLRNMAETIKTDYPGELRKMVEIGILIERAARDVEEPPPVPNIFNTDVTTFLAAADRLQNFHASYNRTLIQSIDLLEIWSPHKAAGYLVSFGSWQIPAAPEEIPVEEPAAAPGLGSAAAGEPARGAPEGAAAALDPSPEQVALAVKCGPPQDDERRILADYRCYVDTMREINHILSIDMGAASFASYKADTVQHVDNLRFWNDITNRWMLPVIYGALGAAVYSIVRYINVFIADPPFRTSFLRIAFGGFTGVTISMLFGPTSAFTMDGLVSTTTLFLVCFLFGYSLDSFLALLRRADSYINSAFTGAQR